jgi:hypothetical protein
MQKTKLPPRPSLEYLRKAGKERLAAMRRTNPGTQLADALLAIAREHGFSSWRALKAEVESRQSTNSDRFIAACRDGDAGALRALLADEPSLVHLRDAQHSATGLHFAARTGHVESVRLLLEAGADPIAEDDSTGLGVIGWAACYLPVDRISRDVVSLLLAQGARHHVFSAIAIGEADLVRAVVEQRPEELDRRMSRQEHGQTPLHFAIVRGRTDLLELLISLGGDPEAADSNGQAPLQFAMLRGDRSAVSCLLGAGVALPPPPEAAAGRDRAGASVQGLIPVLLVKDIGATLRWYTTTGFNEAGRYPTDGTTVYWAMVTLGAASIMFEPGTTDGASATLLLTTNRIHDQYELFKSRQIAALQAELAGEEATGAGVEFVDDLHEPPFGGLRFSIRDCNGYTLQFLQGAVV